MIVYIFFLIAFNAFFAVVNVAKFFDAKASESLRQQALVWAAINLICVWLNSLVLQMPHK